MKARLLGIMTLVGCVLLHGCAVFSPSYTKPEVRLANVEMLKSNLWEQSFRLKLRVDNPNDPISSWMCAPICGVISPT